MTRRRTKDGASPSGRRSISVAAITAAVAHQQREDAANRLDRVTSLMGAIRAFAPLITARKASGFSDPQIVAMLKHHGIEISAETLRVYRSRLSREAVEPDRASPAPSAPPAPPVSVLAGEQGCGGHADGIAPGGAKANGAAGDPLPATFRTPVPATPVAHAEVRNPVAADASGPHEQPGFNRTVTFDDGV
jgi:hypothetical protein